jgi:prefoldin subunit 5
MADPTDIEKKNLEAHVELCAERYRYLEEKLERVETKISNLGSAVNDIRNMMQKVIHKRNDQLVNWGIGIIGALLATVGYLLATFVF